MYYDRYRRCRHCRLCDIIANSEMLAGISTGASINALFGTHPSAFDWCQRGNTVSPFARLARYAAPAYDTSTRRTAAYDIR
ncbi:hypothetical protein E2553_01585 [Paraburkholderia dipogonis]|uniref:Uncharacterized protein n=1 Tax=Paraburkholderia dipogonis TaxID=1211383 RepID=A0A4Y8N2A2_9BURK|nr:hypothetical protein [Paraburkholderia dipogonis]TFE43834.1 hypothetical protein E2553_01585 [Paraburkholderia dipogonis]